MASSGQHVHRVEHAMIPDRERGYSVETDTLVVHERYQDHAPRAMRTSALGVTNTALHRGMEPVACEVCFPPPVVRSSRRKVEVVIPHSAESEAETRARWS